MVGLHFLGPNAGEVGDRGDRGDILVTTVCWTGTTAVVRALLVLIVGIKDVVKGVIVVLSQYVKLFAKYQNGKHQ